MNIGVIGAGGNMGGRVIRALGKKPETYTLFCIENAATGLERLTAQGIQAASLETLRNTEAVILAVPDHHIGTVATSIEPYLQSQTMLITLDPAAAYAGQLPNRPDLTYFVTHPAHPPIFNDDEGAARKDYFGSGLAKQSIVSALVQGSEQDYAKGEQIAKDIFAPLLRSHRVTLEQLAMLEPTLSETIAASLIITIRQAMDIAIQQGIPPEATRDFLLGHINIPLAIAFNEIEWDFSAGAKRMIARGQRDLLRDDWQRVFSKEYLQDSVNEIVHPPKT
jgi:D-apionate oxidoisomerase